MNDAELEKLLQAAPVPERPPEFWDAMPRRISAQVHSRHRQSEKAHLPSQPRGVAMWGWGLAGAAVLLLSGFLLGNWHGTNRSVPLLQSEKLLREVLATFPHQIEAIIQDQTGLRLELADQANVSQSQPLWIRVCDGKSCRAILTFSGQVVQIGGQPVEALADAQGGVMLVGERFFWSSRETGPPNHLSIQAQQLSCVL